MLNFDLPQVLFLKTNAVIITRHIDFVMDFTVYRSIHDAKWLKSFDQTQRTYEGICRAAIQMIENGFGKLRAKELAECIHSRPDWKPDYDCVHFENFLREQKRQFRKISQALQGARAKMDSMIREWYAGETT